MLEVLWTEETTHEDTRYKVLFPITTPLLSRPPQVIDSESYFYTPWLFFFFFGLLFSKWILPAAFIPLYFAPQTRFQWRGCLKCCLAPSAPMWHWWTLPSPRRFCLWRTAMSEALTCWSTCPQTAAPRSLHLMCLSRTVLYYKWWALLSTRETECYTLFFFFFFLNLLFFLLLISVYISQQSEKGVTVYSLHLTFGLLVLPEFAPFSHTAYLETKLMDIGM